MRSITLSLSSPSTLVATTLTSPYHSDFHFDLSLSVQNPVFVVTLSFCVNTIWIIFQFKMTSKEEFRAFAHAMVDYIIDYHETIKSRSVNILFANIQIFSNLFLITHLIIDQKVIVNLKLFKNIHCFWQRFSCLQPIFSFNLSWSWVYFTFAVLLHNLFMIL